MALLEGRCAHEAALEAGDADIAALEGLHRQLQDSAAQGRIPDYYAANYAIHEAIIAIAGNKWLAQVIGDLRKILKLARLQQLNAPGRLAQSLAEHMAVFAALKARDAEGAEAAMRTHLIRQREALRQLARQQKSRIAAVGTEHDKLGVAI
jgi:DNA-binding GntR family transcriptional regulator